MKNTPIYFISLIAFAFIILVFKMVTNKFDKREDVTLQTSKYVNVKNAEIEILNGCGDAGIANLFTNYLREQQYDVIDIRNAEHFNYKNTIILVHKVEKMKAANDLAKMLHINKEHIKTDNNIWDLSIIIGKDYKDLISYKEISKYYEPF